MSDLENTRKRLSNINIIISQSDFPEDDEHIETARKQLRGILEPAGKDVAILATMWEDINILLKDVVLCKQAIKLRKLFGDFRNLYLNLEEEALQKSPRIIQTWCEVFTEIISKGKLVILQWFVAPVVYHIQDKCQPVKRDSALWTAVFKAIMKHPDQKMLETVVHALKNAKFKRIFDWKKNWKEGQSMVQQITRVKVQTEDQTKDKWVNKSILGVYANIVINIVDQFEQIQISEMIALDVVELHIIYMEKYNKTLNHLPYLIGPKLPTLQNYKAYIPGLIGRFEEMFLDTAYPWTDSSSDKAGEAFITCVLHSYREGSEIPYDVNMSLFTIFHHCLKDDVDKTENEHGEPTIYLSLMRESFYLFFDVHKDTDSQEVLSLLIPLILKMMAYEDEAEGQEIGYRVIQSISQAHPHLFVNYMSNIIDWYKTTFDIEALYLLFDIYRDQNGQSLGDGFQNLFDAASQDEKNITLHTQMFRVIAEKIPEVFTEENVGKLLTKHIHDETLRRMVMDTLVAIALEVPDRIPADLVIQTLLRQIQFEEDNYKYLCDILVNVALTREHHVDAITDELLSLCKKCQGPTNCIPLVNGLKTIAEKYGSTRLKWHRAYFEELKISYAVEDLKVAVTQLIDVMEGRGIPRSDESRKQQRKNLRLKKVAEQIVLDNKILEKLASLSPRAEQKPKNQPKKKGQKKKTKAGTKVKDEDVPIPKKPVVVFPTWFGDIANLLNPKKKNNWKLLANRLGYGHMDVEGWESQNNPCMGMLRKWYSTHKTTEDRHDVFSSLLEMGRLDAAAIVENTFKVIDDIPEKIKDNTKPTHIFLSYQFSLQNEVQLLRNHLQQAGFDCFMDIGQLGDGESLLEKIDSKIQESKIVICCVTEKFTKSPNCEREVKLAAEHDKSLIPLLMENIKLPPEGPLRPILSEHLFVRFYRRENEEAKEDTYWPVHKFQELLMLITLEILPDDALLTDEYDEWWEPLAEETNIPKKIGNAQPSSDEKTSKKEKHKSPDIFISYQWSMQSQVKRLYRRLTRLGASCWMDIYRINESVCLNELIDRGLRECKVILSCITKKYTLSAHCRREVILADAINKPIVPLMLEKIKWPPSGPMKMIFTNVRFIDCDSDVQRKWKGDTFEKILLKIQEIDSKITFDEDEEVEDLSDINEDSEKDNNVEEKDEDKTSPSNKAVDSDQGKEEIQELAADKLTNGAETEATNADNVTQADTSKITEEKQGEENKLDDSQNVCNIIITDETSAEIVETSKLEEPSNLGLLEKETKQEVTESPSAADTSKQEEKLDNPQNECETIKSDETSTEILKTSKVEEPSKDQEQNKSEGESKPKETPSPIDTSRQEKPLNTDDLEGTEITQTIEKASKSQETENIEIKKEIPKQEDASGKQSDISRTDEAKDTQKSDDTPTPEPTPKPDDATKQSRSCILL